MFFPLLFSLSLFSLWISSLSHSLAPHSHPSCSLIHSHTCSHSSSHTPWKCRWNFKWPQCFSFCLRDSHCLNRTHSDVHAVKRTLNRPALCLAPSLPSPTPTRPAAEPEVRRPGSHSVSFYQPAPWLCDMGQIA